MGTRFLHIGKTGIDAAKRGLQVSGHNVANANTKGFSRQRANTSTMPPVAEGPLLLGNGADIKSIVRVNDPIHEVRLNKSSSEFHFHKQRTELLTLLEGIYSEIKSKGLHTNINDFFNSFKELANQPENYALRSVVRDTATLLVNQFHRIREQTDRLISNVNRTISESVYDLNSIFENIAELNVKIRQTEAKHEEASDLRDSRDRYVSKVAEYLQITTYTDEKGRYIINADRIGTLVSGSLTLDLTTGIPKPEDPKDDFVNNQVYFKGHTNHPLGTIFRNGKLGAIYQTRNKEIRQFKDKLDFVAYNISKLTNAVHRKGHLSFPKDQEQMTNNQNFFKELESFHSAAKKMDLKESVKEDLTNIVTSANPNSPGDNKVALAISKIQDEKLFKNNTATIEDEYLETMAELGLITGKSKINLEQSESILAGSQAFKERISGVSLDEETANMMKHQHAYAASARVMRVAEELFKTILDIKR